MVTIKTGCRNNTLHPISVKTACEHELENDFPPSVYILFYYMLYSSKDFLVKRVFVVLQSITKGKGLHLVVHCIGQFQFLNSFSLFFCKILKIFLIFSPQHICKIDIYSSIYIRSFIFQQLQVGFTYGKNISILLIILKDLFSMTFDNCR